MWDKVKKFFFVSIYQVITWVWIGLSIAAYFHNLGNKNARGVRWATISLILSVVTMLIFVWKRIFSDGDEAPKRPELYISGAGMLPLEAGKPETVVLELKNRGNRVARNIRLGRGNHIFIPAPFTGPLECKPSESDTRPDLGPDEVSSLISPSKNPLSQKRISDLQDGRLLFFHCLEGEYEGDDGTVYPADFCYMYSTSAPTVMRICPERYWPKDRKDRKWPERPELSLERSTISFSANTSPQINIFILNRGQTTAHNIALQGLDYTYRKPFTGRLELVANDVWDVYPNLSPGAGATAFTLRTRPLSPKQIKEILKGKLLFFHCTTGKYEDAAGNQYPFNLCFMYRYRHAGHGPVRLLAIAPIEHWPEEYCPDQYQGKKNPN